MVTMQQQPGKIKMKFVIQKCNQRNYRYFGGLEDRKSYQKDEMSRSEESSLSPTVPQQIQDAELANQPNQPTVGLLGVSQGPKAVRDNWRGLVRRHCCVWLPGDQHLFKSKGHLSPY